MSKTIILSKKRFLDKVIVSLVSFGTTDNMSDHCIDLLESLLPAVHAKCRVHEKPITTKVLNYYLDIQNLKELSRDKEVPKTLRSPISFYLEGLNGYGDDFDDKTDDALDNHKEIEELLLRAVGKNPEDIITEIDFSEVS